MNDLVVSLRKSADALENGPYVSLKTAREEYRAAADRIAALEALALELDSVNEKAAPLIGAVLVNLCATGADIADIDALQDALIGIRNALSSPLLAELRAKESAK